MEMALAPMADRGDPKKVAKILVDSVVTRPRLWHLLAVSPISLEQNISIETLIESKKTVIRVLLRMANALKAALPSMSMDNTMKLIGCFGYQLPSRWYAKNPPEIYSQITELPEFSTLQRDEVSDLTDSIYYMIKGILAEAQE